MLLSHGLRAAAGAGGAADPNFKQVALLLHGDGTNGAQNNTFTDSSTNNFTITRNGNSTQGAFTPFSQAPGYWSNYFDGSGDYLTVPDNNAFTFDADFTVEAWIYIENTSTVNRTFVAHWPGVTATNCSFIFGTDTTGYLRFGYGIGSLNTAVVGTSQLVPLNAWTHVAVTRSGSTLRFFVNGNLDSSTFTVSGALNNSTASLTIGVTTATNSEPMLGYISNLRLVKGTAVYTGSFTPSTTPLTAITNTSLLTCQSNRFLDNSANSFAVTRNGDASVQAFSPFAPTAAYSTSVNGGSGYFDGTGDFLNIASNAALNPGNGAFTFECWFYPTVAWSQAVGSGNVLWITEVTSGLQIGRPDSGTGNVWGLCENAVAWRLTSSTLPVTRMWNHLAVVRSGTGTNQTALFLNGVRLAQGTVTTTFAQGATYLMDGTSSGATETTGYISGMRFVKGSAVYDPASSTYTIPTAPLTAITNTQLLLNFTNAGIFDNAMKNDLETVGNAQISTSVKKYGTGSLAFDGTGDWLLIPNNTNQQLGTGNFTIEMWVYRNSSGTYGLVSKGTSTTGWSVSLNSSNQVVFSYASSTTTSSGTVAATTWTYIAVVREGTGSNQTKIYINGTNDGTGTVSTDFNQTNAMYVGADRAAGSAFNGYIDDLRITKGIARYTANFTPPAQAFPNQ